MRRIRKFIPRVMMLFILLMLMFSNVNIKAEYSNPEKEFRAVWISSLVSDVNSYSSEASFKAEMTSVFNIMEYYNLNAMIFHIRTHNNALYDSELNPVASWWRNVSFETFDPLEWLIDECHKRGIEFHAWMNPYRVNSSYYGESLPTNNPASNSSNLLSYNGSTILNPGLPIVREFVIDTVMEVIEKYDVDAIHFDDYFYINLGANGSTSGTNTILNEPDQSTFIQYKGNYNTNSAIDKANWRREQINIFIKNLHDTMTEYNENNNRFVQLGIAPTGIYKNGDGNVTYDANGKPITNGSATGGQTHYSSYLFCDSLKWVTEEWIDYILPQSYWATNHGSAAYAKVMGWWNKVVKNVKVNLYSGIGLYMADESSNTYNWKNDPNELLNQLTYITTLENVKGASIYSFRYIRNAYNNTSTDKMSYAQVSKIGDGKASWNQKVLLPEIKSMDKVTIGSVNNFKVVSKTLSWNVLNGAKFYAIYRSTGNVTFSKNELVTMVGGQLSSWTDTDNGNYNYGIVPISYTNTIGTGVTYQVNPLNLHTDTGESKGTEVTINNGEIDGKTIQVGFTRNAYLDNNAPDQSRLKYAWASSNPSVATVSEYGTITAKSVGTTIISAVYLDDQNYQGQMEITVYDKYIVTFVDWDNEVISTQTVISGENAIKPTNPERNGYTFIGWDKGYLNVQSDLTIKAMYNVNKYTVIFKDYDGTILSTQTIEHGHSAYEPALKERENYVFEGWDKDYQNVTSDLVISALYREIKYSVRLLTNNDNGAVQLTYNNISRLFHEGPYGFEVTLEVIYNQGAFQFWVADGKIISFNQTFTFNATKNHVITAYFAEEGKYAVSYVDSNMSLVNFVSVESGNDALTTKEPSTKPGYIFNGWANITIVTKHEIIYATYTKIDDVLTVTVNNGTFKNTNENIKDVVYGSLVTVVNNESNFSHWLINNHIASFSPTYSFSVYQDTVVTAVTNSTEIKDFIMFMHKPIFDESKQKVAFYGNFGNPKGLKIEEIGVIYYRGANVDPLTVEGVKVRIYKYSPQNEYSVFFTLSPNESVSVRLYAVTNQGENIYYSNYEAFTYETPGNNITYELNSGAFYQYENREAMISDFLNDFNNLKGLNIENPNQFFALTYESNVFDIFTAYENKWLWLREYIIEIATVNSYGNVAGLNSKTDNVWRSNLWAFLNKTVRTEWPASFDFTNSTYNNNFWDKIKITVSENYTFGEDYILPKPYKANFIFAGWYDNSDLLGEAVTEIKATDKGNKTFYAKWN